MPNLEYIAETPSNHFWNIDNKIVHKQISRTIQNSLQTIKTGNKEINKTQRK